MKCSRCKVDKQETEFVIGERGAKRCEKCQKYIADYYKRNRDRAIERAKNSFSKKNKDEWNAYKRKLCRRNPILHLLWAIKTKCKKEGIEFSLSRHDLVVPSHCPVLGIPLFVGNESAHDNSPSIDRIDPNGGYTKNNVVVISHRANTIKSNATAEELKKVLEYVEKHDKLK